MCVPFLVSLCYSGLPGWCWKGVVRGTSLLCFHLSEKVSIFLPLYFFKIYLFIFIQLQLSAFSPLPSIVFLSMSCFCKVHLLSFLCYFSTYTTWLSYCLWVFFRCFYWIFLAYNPIYASNYNFPSFILIFKVQLLLISNCIDVYLQKIFKW